MSVNMGSKTLTGTASTIGTATNRSYLRVTNESTTVRARVGDDGTTISAGVIIEPGASQEFRTTPADDTAIYGASEGAKVTLAYYEMISA